MPPKRAKSAFTGTGRTLGGRVVKAKARRLTKAEKAAKEMEGYVPGDGEADGEGENESGGGKGKATGKGKGKGKAGARKPKVKRHWMEDSDDESGPQYIQVRQKDGTYRKVYDGETISSSANVVGGISEKELASGVIKVYGREKPVRGVRAETEKKMRKVMVDSGEMKVEEGKDGIKEREGGEPFASVGRRLGDPLWKTDED